MTREDFLAGVPIEFDSHGGRRLRATFRRSPLVHLRITTADGRRVADPIVSEATALHWFDKVQNGGIMKTVILALALASALPSDSIAAPASARSAFGPSLPTDTQFVLMERFYVETITCKSWFARNDFNEYGEIDGTGCTITGDLPADVDSQLGHVDVHFDIGGTRVDLSGCRIDSTAADPGWAQYTIDCT